MRKVCENCGSIYELTRTKIFMRDKDSITCQVCDEELYSWNESAFYSAKLIEAKKLHEDKKPE